MLHPLAVRKGKKSLYLAHSSPSPPALDDVECKEDIGTL